jgi:hypothetical protein
MNFISMILNYVQEYFIVVSLLEFKMIEKCYPVQKALNLSSLSDRRHAANLHFLRELLKSMIVSHINFRVPIHQISTNLPFSLLTIYYTLS